MDWKTIILILSLIANLFLVLFSFINSKRKRVNIIWSFVVLSVVLWISAMIVYRLSPPENNIFWCKLLYLFAAFIPYIFLQFTFLYPDRLPKQNIIKQVATFLPLIFIAFIIFYNGLLIKNVLIIPDKEKTIIWGPLYFLYSGYISIYFSWSLVNLFNHYRKLEGILKTQARYVILGTSISILFGSIFNLILPWLGNFSFNWAGQVATLFMVAVVSYAIVRYRLMDIRLTMSKGMVYILSFLTVIGFSLLLISANGKFFQPASELAVNIFIAIFSVVFFDIIFRFYENIAKRHFYYAFYNYQTVIAGLGDKITHVLDIDTLTVLIASTLTDTMKIERTVILLRDETTGKYSIKKNIGFREENGISLVKDSVLTDYLEKIQGPLVREELSLIIQETTGYFEKRGLEDLSMNMEKIEAAVCLPLLIERKIIGMIVLGNKVSGDSYSEEDIQLLTSLANQASIALKNAQLYSQVRVLTQNLQQQIDLQTTELVIAYSELKKLDRAKSEFISMASHQLRTPLTTIKGYVSMMLEGNYGRLSKMKKDKLANVFLSNERLIKLVNDLLTISRIELGKIELYKTPILLEELLLFSYEEMLPFCKEKSLPLIISNHRPAFRLLISTK